MSTKLVFSSSSFDDCKNVVTTLKSLGLDDDDIGVLADDSSRLGSLPEADLLENDAVPAVKQGGVAGAAVGLLAGLGLSVAAPGIVLGGAGVALATVGGASVGALASTLFGASAPNSHLLEYESILQRGDFLIIADASDSNEQEIKAALEALSPSPQHHGVIPDTAPIS